MNLINIKHIVTNYKNTEYVCVYCEQDKELLVMTRDLRIDIPYSKVRYKTLKELNNEQQTNITI